MGNICSCFSKSESNGNVSSTNHPFNQPGRTLDSAPPPQPAKGATRDPKSMGWGQSSSNQVPERGLGGDEQPQRRETDSDMRAAMAQAAEARAQDKKPKGKLGKSLDRQQRRTGTENLQDTSSREVGARRQDENQTAILWD